MNFQVAEDEMRQRFSESRLLLTSLFTLDYEDFQPATDTEKALRGLWLVSLYGAVERSVNTVVEQALEEITSHRSPSANCHPSLWSIFHHSSIKAMRDCSDRKLVGKSVDLFNRVYGLAPLELAENPLSYILQNVDSNTMSDVATFFGSDDFRFDLANGGRLRNLRERRNAVAHGRESASSVGERFTINELRQMYEAADTETTRFFLHMKDYCTNKSYLHRVA